MKTFKEECIALRKEDYSLVEIARLTGRPKTSVYAHIRGLPLSEKRIETYKKASAERLKKSALSRKGKSKRSFKKFINWNPSRVLLMAHLSFDGGIRSHQCEYNNRSRALVDRVQTLMSGIYRFAPKEVENPTTRVIRIAYYNVELSAFLRKKSEQLLNEIEFLDIRLQREFLRAFFDDEGCMDYRPRRGVRQIRGYQKDTSVLESVQRMLNRFGIQSRVVMPNEVIISGRLNLLSFQEKIGFSPGVCVNGNRANSIWRENLEKRELLSRALASFGGQ